mmetsp:Transcript_102057/g.243361  ORF Transcript_102057/g.243361 Transcript_102057/m.243361 type:complete len:253 (+) Transcript_102057:1909-2667(+)
MRHGIVCSGILPAHGLDDRASSIMVLHVEVQLVNLAVDAGPAVAGGVVLGDLCQRDGVLPAHAAANRGAPVRPHQLAIHVQEHLKVGPGMLSSERRSSVCAAPGVDHIASRVSVAGDVVHPAAENHPTVSSSTVRGKFGVRDDCCWWYRLVRTATSRWHLRSRPCEIWSGAGASATARHGGAVGGAATHTAFHGREALLHHHGDVAHWMRHAVKGLRGILATLVSDGRPSTRVSVKVAGDVHNISVHCDPAV